MYFLESKKSWKAGNFTCQAHLPFSFWLHPCSANKEPKCEIVEGGREVEYILLPHTSTLDMKALAHTSVRVTSACSSNCNSSSQCYGPVVTIKPNFLYFPNLWVEAPTPAFTGPAVMTELNVTGHLSWLVFPSSSNVFISSQFPILNLFLLKIPRVFPFSLMNTADTASHLLS